MKTWRWYSYSLKINENTNIASYIQNREGLNFVNIENTKKECFKHVESLNNLYKTQNKYMFKEVQ